MQLAFETKQLRVTCESEEEAAKIFGEEAAARLRRRLADLRAAEWIEDLQVGRPRLRSDKSELIIELADGWQMFCVPNHIRPREDQGAPDWSRIRRIKIIDIRCDHA